ncbi:MAG: efflux RND transporter permease subunit, partial [Janthinobacterium lividum]
LAPLQMILSIPLELSGVFIGLFLAHQSFSSVSIMAVVILTGMDITTAILLIDQIRRRRRECPELTREEAVALACRDRLRPILLTSLITIITMLPVALAPKTGMDAYQPLGTVIVSGLLVGTLLSLMVIPVMHVLVDDLGKRLRPNRKNAAAIGLALLLACFPILPTRADTPTQTLSLSQAIALGTVGSPDLLGAQADAEAAAAAVHSASAQTRLGLSTTTYATVGDSSNILTTSPGVAPQNIFLVPSHGFADQNLMLMLPLTTGGRLEANLKAAQKQSTASAFSASAVRLQVRSAITQAYANALLGSALVDAAQSRLTAEDEQVRITQERVTVGRSAPVDLLREQAEQADAHQAVLEAQNNAATALVNLKSVVGISQESSLTLSDTLDTLTAAVIPSMPTTIGAALQEASAHRPELPAASLRVDAAQSAIRAMRGAYLPQISAVAMGDAMTNDGAGSRSGYTVGLTASLPLLDGGSRRADVDAATARLHRAQSELEKTKRQVASEAATAWLAEQSAAARVPDAQLGVTAARQAYTLADLRYNAGKSVSAERLDALAALTRAEGTLASARAALIVARAQKQVALGEVPKRG